MAYWLMKSEPDEFSIKDLHTLGEARWDGVRNYQARNFMRAMAVGDLFFFYHSSCPQPGIAGIGRISEAAYPDPTALDPESHYFDPKASAEKKPVERTTGRPRADFPQSDQARLPQATNGPGRNATGPKRQPPFSDARYG